MKRKLSLSLCLALSCFMANLAGQEAETTIWNGTLKMGGDSLRLKIEIDEVAGELTGKLTSLDQNNAILPITDIIMDGKTLNFSVPKVGAEFSGAIVKNGMVSEGTFRQGEGQTTLTLSRQDPDSATTTEQVTDPLQDLGNVVSRYVERNLAVGAELLVIEKGKTVFHKSFGLKDREDNTAWENNTLCNIRSMTKPITSTAAQILIDREMLELDVPVATYLDSFNEDVDSKKITVRQVLTHRSGLPLTNLLHPNQYPSLSKQVAAAGENGPQFEPGSKFWYSDIGTDVVGALVEKVSGELLNEFVQREIFEPLGMSNTLYGIDASDSRFSQAASLYLKNTDDWTKFWKPETKPLYPFAWGSQTVYSTTSDYAKFLRMLMNRGRVGDRQLISEEAVDRMLAPVSRMKMLGSDASYPTGFRNLETYYGQMMVTHRVIGKEKEKPVIIGHSGSDGTNAWAWPDKDLIICYFTQSRGGMTPLRIESHIDRLLINAGEDLAEENPKETLREAWVGTLDLGGLKPVMQFRIVDTAAGKTAAYFDSVTEARTGFDATWSIKGKQLHFDVAEIKLTYRGTLNDSRDSAEGTWSQGGRNVPLTLTKQKEDVR